jgi:SAM-dependent methyltransferase
MEPASKPSTTALNRAFYHDLWSRARLDSPERFNTWPVISEFGQSAAARLEVGPGMHPRLPIAGTHFLDLSAFATEQLNRRGGIAVTGDITQLPFRDGEFDLIAAFDVIEHVDDDHQVFRELNRVLRDGGTLIFSVPVHAALWTEFDDLVGHVRRYEPAALVALLAEHGLMIERSAGFGMKPSNGRLVKWGMWWLAHHPDRAMWWHNRVFAPLGLFFQKRLAFTGGLIEAAEVQGLVLICRRGGARLAG